MRTFSSTTVVEQPAASNRRQPVRQTRTNPSRTASNVAQAQGGASAQLADNERIENPGFFPALTHYTDAIAALPKEMIRHNTMLKEVDAKIYGPEERLVEQLNTAVKLPIPPHSKPLKRKASDFAMQDSSMPSNSLLPPDGESRREPSPRPNPDPQDTSDPTYPRRLHFHNMRSTLYEMLATLDEKNHVINTAIDCLDKQTKRCNSSYPHIEDEISEEARLGSLTHWAYTDKAAEKPKGIMAGERTRRAANTAAAIQEAEVAALRSESRREALAAKKPRNQHVDSDFDDGRAAGKKIQPAGKGRKALDASLGGGVGLGIVNGAVPNKRRKIEKTAPGNPGVERAMSSVYGSSLGPTRGSAGNPKDLSVNDATGKKKGRGGAVATNGTSRRRSVLSMRLEFGEMLTTCQLRAGTNASAINSPSLASSPVVGTFSIAKDRQGGRSPAPATLQRMPSSRARQNSTQNVIQMSRNRSPSANHKATNGKSMHSTTADVEKVSNLTGRSTSDIKPSMKETVKPKGEHLVEDIGSADGAGDLRGGIVVGSRTAERALKREESITTNGNNKTRPPSISVSTRNNNGSSSKQASKTATPISTSFSEPQPRTRPQREMPQKRSHKKGAGLAAQLAAAAATARGDETAEMQGDDDEEGSDEPRYCYCNGVSYGEMVGCDGKECQREWFHLDCVGLEKAPGKNGMSLFLLQRLPFGDDPEKIGTGTGG